MNPGPHARRDRTRLLIWWIVWAAQLSALVVVDLVHGRGPLAPGAAEEKVLTGLVGLVPLFMSIVIRWLVLPRYGDLLRALPMFIVGLALAEAGGLLGIFFGGPYRDDLFLLGVLGLAQFVPFFAKKFLEPTPTGYIPNN
ncbi:MAG: hypothetical protein HY302_11980 [Opitutae bacterium]|nr:hypothetical protein [Opitutae bacterium]